MTLLGLIAGALTTACWLPQLRKSWRTRSTADFSWAYLAVFGTGIALWMAYGIGKHDVAIVVTNGLTLTLTLGVVGLKVWFEVRNGTRPASPPRPPSIEPDGSRLATRSNEQRNQ